MKKIKKLTLSQAKKKAWIKFSLYIRKLHECYEANSDQHDGFAQCYTCEKWFPLSKLQAGHGIPGRNNAVLFLEEVVKPQCVGCNIFQHGRLDVFTQKLIKELGQEEYDNMQRLSNMVVKYTVNDYLDIEKSYKEKLEAL